MAEKDVLKPETKINPADEHGENLLNTVFDKIDAEGKLADGLLTLSRLTAGMIRLVTDRLECVREDDANFLNVVLSGLEKMGATLEPLAPLTLDDEGLPTDEALKGGAA